jgi:hypothetical protein
LQKALIIDKDDQVARDSLISMGAERYIPKDTKTPPEVVGPSPTTTEEGADGEKGTMPPEEWGEEDAFESVDDGQDASSNDREMVKERPLKKILKRTRAGTDQNDGPEKVNCPRCSTSFKPITDRKGHFECPSCGLRGRLELD